jgi:hypothetical protein
MTLTAMTRDQLRKQAAALDIPGRGTMLKPELVAAIEKAQAPKLGHATPLDVSARLSNYARQNGTARTTPRQRRRAAHKLNRSFRSAVA